MEKTEDGKQRPAAAVQAVVLSDGQVVSGTYLDQYAIKATDGDAASNQLPPDRFDKTYSGDGLVRPLYNLEALARLLEMNTYHWRATVTKANDVAGRGWRLMPAEGIEEPSEEQKQLAKTFFTGCSPSLPLGELFKRVMIDYDAVGNAYIEIVRSPVSGLPKTLAHAPAHTFRRHEDFLRYAQRRGQKTRWFKAAGSQFDVDMQSGKVGSGKEIAVGSRASELIHLMNYSSRSDYYGMPDVLPAMGAVLGDLYRRDYNIKFFENHAIPAYAVTVTGAELDEETEKRIEEFFQRKLKDNPHSTLVLYATGGEGNQVQFKFDKLNVDVKEASFRLFRQDNRDEVLTAHGVPPYRAGIAEVGSLGQNVAGATTEIYKDSIIGPRQRMLEWHINQYILAPLGVTEWQFEFEEIDTADEGHQANMDDKYFRMGARTPNDILRAQGKEPVDDPAMDAYYIDGRPITGPLAGTDPSGDLVGSVKDLHRQLAEIALKGGGQP